MYENTSIPELKFALAETEATLYDAQEAVKGLTDELEAHKAENDLLRGRLAAKERELEVARLAHKATDKDRQDALDMLDAAGVWTGMDLLVHDRVASLIRDWQEQQRKIITLQGQNGHLTRLQRLSREFLDTAIAQDVFTGNMAQSAYQLFDELDNEGDDE
jgi:regulator of replication initiation timing